MKIFLLLWCLFAQASDCTVFMSRARGHAYELEARRDNKPVGHLMYSVEGDSAHIAIILVDPIYQNNGVSRELVGHMLARDPVHTVTALLVLDNFEASELDASALTTFAECVQAIRKTPLYRALSKFGFVKVNSCRHTRGAESIGLELEKVAMPTPRYL